MQGLVGTWEAQKGARYHAKGLPSGIFSSSSAMQCHLFIITQAWHAFNLHLCHECHPCQGLPSLPRHPGTKEDLGGHYLGGVGRRERGGNVSDFDGSAMPSRLVGISKVAAYCLRNRNALRSVKLHFAHRSDSWTLGFSIHPIT